MAPRGAHHIIETSLMIGIQFDDFDYRLFLREYHRDMRNRFPAVSFPDYEPGMLLDELIPQYEPEGQEGLAGGRYRVLRDFAQRTHHLDLTMTASDFGPFEQRKSPYSFDRAFYHLGREVGRARLKMEFPGYNPYRSTRKWSIDFVREHLDDVLEILPDYLWWEMHDERDALANSLSAEKTDEARRRIESAGYKVESFGLYLTTLETLHMENGDVPE